MDPNGGINPNINPNQNPEPVQTPFPPQQPMVQPTAPILESPSSAPGLAQPDLAQQQFTGQSLQQPASEMQPTKGSGLKVVLIIVAALVVTLGLSGGAYMVGFTGGKKAGRTEADAEYQRQQAQLQQEDDVLSDMDEDDLAGARLEIGDLSQPVYEDQALDGEIGEQLTAGDGLVLKVVNVERNYQTSDPNYKADPSKELIKVNFLVGNASNDKPKDVSNFGFRLEDSSGALLTPENIAEYPDKFDTIKIDEGGQQRASIVYKVNKDEKPLSFIREQRYRITTENREVTTRMVVVLAQ